MIMKETEITEEIETGDENLSLLHIEDSKCDCTECRSGRKHYVQILDVDRYVEQLNDWD